MLYWKESDAGVTVGMGRVLTVERDSASPVLHPALPQLPADLSPAGPFLGISRPATLNQVLQNMGHEHSFQGKPLVGQNALEDLAIGYSVERNLPSQDLVACHREAVDIRRPLIVMSSLQVRFVEHLRCSPRSCLCHLRHHVVCGQLACFCNAKIS